MLQGSNHLKIAARIRVILPRHFFQPVLVGCTVFCGFVSQFGNFYFAPTCPYHSSCQSTLCTLGLLMKMAECTGCVRGLRQTSANLSCKALSGFGCKNWCWALSCAQFGLTRSAWNVLHLIMIRVALKAKHFMLCLHENFPFFFKLS